MLPDYLLPFVFFVVGPTASGKSTVALEIAAQAGAQIVGADAFQVYRGLDILTAKPTAAMLGRVPHNLIGEVPFESSFDVKQYLRQALGRISMIVATGQPVVIVGGTGLYVRALTLGLADLPQADPALRTQLGIAPLEQLQLRLKELDPEAAIRIDLKNPRRLIRALEVCLLTGKPFSSFQTQWNAPQRPVSGIFLSPERDILNQNIDQRTLDMFDQGVVEEVRNAATVGDTASQAIGFAQIRALLAGTITKARCIASIQEATRRYAKRQLTWFRQQPRMAVATPETLDIDALASILRRNAR